MANVFRSKTSPESKEYAALYDAIANRAANSITEKKYMIELLKKIADKEINYTKVMDTKLENVPLVFLDNFTE